MATNYVNEGDVIDYVAGANIVSGEIVGVGKMACIALGDIANGETGVLMTEGVFNLPKITGAISVGDSIDFDVSLGSVTTGLTPATGDITSCGVAIESALSGDATVQVKLLPGAGTLN